MMSFAMPSGCCCGTAAVGCVGCGRLCAGAVPAAAGGSGAVTKVGVCAAGLGSAGSGIAGVGLGAPTVPDDSCSTEPFSALSSSTVRGGDACGAAGAVNGCVGASASGSGAVG